MMPGGCELTNSDVRPCHRVHAALAEGEGISRRGRVLGEETPPRSLRHSKRKLISHPSRFQ